MSEHKRDVGWRVLDVILALVVAVASSLVLWTGKTVVDMRESLAAIEASRFTAEDGLAVWKEISTIREDIATLPREVPPAWFVNEVRELKNEVRDLRELIEEMRRDSN
jgi:hypothetical protein